jgi:hypothetical protein
VPVEQSEFSFEMAEGRHSWIEVYISDLGWLPFDAQQTEFFVSNRYLRIEYGRDNSETIQDGLVRWSGIKSPQPAVPHLEEVIGSEFINDDFEFTAREKVGSIRKLLLTPPVTGEAVMLAEGKEDSTADKEPEIIEEKPEVSTEQLPEADYTQLHYSEPLELGNLDFPRKFDFLSSKFEATDPTKVSGEIRRNFIVETAEYVTGKKQFAQMFVLEEPIVLRNISLALHCFGGEGDLWVNIADDQRGQPSSNTYASQKVRISYQPSSAGYDWTDFRFDHHDLLLTPGKYWISLNYSGSPIVNWFYSYGKPVGPVEGTRSRKWGEGNWGSILSYEFNYKINGLSSLEIESR